MFSEASFFLVCSKGELAVQSLYSSNCGHERFYVWCKSLFLNIYIHYANKLQVCRQALLYIMPAHFISCTSRMVYKVTSQKYKGHRLAAIIYGYFTLYKTNQSACLVDRHCLCFVSPISLLSSYHHYAQSSVKP